MRVRVRERVQVRVRMRVHVRVRGCVRERISGKKGSGSLAFELECSRSASWYAWLQRAVAIAAWRSLCIYASVHGVGHSGPARGRWVRGVAAVERMGILEGVARVGGPPDCAKELGELVLHERRDLLFALRAGRVRRVLLRIFEQGREGLVGLAAHITQEQVKRLPHAAAAVTRPPPNLGERWRNR